MMKTVLVLLLGSLSVASCKDKAYPAKFTVEVVDEKGNPIPGIALKTATYSHWEPGEAFGTDVADVRDSKTNKNGISVFDHPSKRGTFSIYAMPSEGYYKAFSERYEFQKVVNGRWSPENPTISYVLKKKRNPIPMYAKNFSNSSRKALPGYNKKYGYDFEAGDWVAPHGKGKTTDIYFLVKFSKEANGDFDSSIEVTFPNEKDGLIYFEDKPREGSEFVSDYLAPLKGYQKQKLLRRFQKDGKITSEINRQLGNYYLRLRTRLDEKGDIESAHYAKIYGDFMYFTYYFNPMANDRNVEFDPRKNLFKKERVNRP